MRTALALAALWFALTGCAADEVRPKAGTDWAPAPTERAGLRVLAESDARGLRLHTRSGAKTFLPGINLGSSVPGRQPGEVGLIEASTYRGWLEQMGDLGIRVVRVYTLHPPAFYDELARYNRAHPRDPLYLVQGAYLPNEDYYLPGRTLYSPEVDESFADELADLSDAVHGDLTRPASPGSAGGSWRTDVSPWLASWIIGVEWDPQGVLRTDRREAAAPPHRGRYFASTPEATPTERWITRHLDTLAAMEAERGVSVPIAAANWPTADPLEHPTEPIPLEDAASVDAMHMLPTPAWPGGTYASFHAYPYYPDFQRYERGYDAVEWEGRPDRYAGYLTALKEHYASRMPLVISEFGVPSSLGSAHLGTNGRDQGGHSEQQAMAMNASMMRMMAGLGLGGAFVFSWEDEWFKRTWNTIEHQDPERRQLWNDPLTNEQHFGLIATDPGRIPDGAAEISPVSGPFEYAYVWADHSWVHLELTARDGLPASVLIEADTMPALRGPDHRFTVDVEADTALAEVRRELDPIRLDTVAPYRPDQDEPWHRYDLIVNRPLQGRPAEYQQVGDLRRGTWDPQDEDYDSRSTWQVDQKRGTLRLRIPWPMLGLADPSARRALGPGRPAELVRIEGISFDLSAAGRTTRLDFSWPTWNQVSYTTRPKAGIETLEGTYRALAP